MAVSVRFRALVLAGAATAYSLAMLGSWTRINGAGMTCPDWPLCHGAVVPALHGKIVLEWLHRLLALVETFLVAGVVVTGVPLRAKMPALRPMLIALASLFALQIVLGGVTIRYANSPLSVMAHWTAATLLLAAFSILAVLAWTGTSALAAPARRSPAPYALPMLTAGCALAATCAGAYMSSSGAGLACPGLPGCAGTVLGTTAAQGVHMLHRVLAAALVVVAVATVVRLPRPFHRTHAVLRAALTLLALQVTLGVLMVLWSLPTALREAHAATAMATVVAFVVAAIFAALEAGAFSSDLLGEDLPRQALQQPGGRAQDDQHDGEILEPGEARDAVAAHGDRGFGEREVQTSERV